MKLIDSSEFDTRIIAAAKAEAGYICVLLKTASRDDEKSAVLIFSDVDLSLVFSEVTEIDLIDVTTNEGGQFSNADFVFVTRNGQIILYSDQSLHTAEAISSVVDVISGVREVGEYIVAFGEAGQAFVREDSAIWRKFRPDETSIGTQSLLAAGATGSGVLYFGGFTVPPLQNEALLADFFAGNATLDSAMEVVENAERSQPLLLRTDKGRLKSVQLPMSAHIFALSPSEQLDTILAGTSLGQVLALSLDGDMQELAVFDQAIENLEQTDNGLVVTTVSDVYRCPIGTDEFEPLPLGQRDVNGNVAVFTNTENTSILVNRFYLELNSKPTTLAELPEEIVSDLHGGD